MGKQLQRRPVGTESPIHFYGMGADLGTAAGKKFLKSWGGGIGAYTSRGHERDVLELLELEDTVVTIPGHLGDAALAL
jgi:hypothetical protein